MNKKQFRIHIPQKIRFFIFWIRALKANPMIKFYTNKDCYLFSDKKESVCFDLPMLPSFHTHLLMIKGLKLILSFLNSNKSYKKINKKDIGAGDLIIDWSGLFIWKYEELRPHHIKTTIRGKNIEVYRLKSK
jgi:hypothetical protein